VVVYQSKKKKSQRQSEEVGEGGRKKGKSARSLTDKGKAGQTEDTCAARMVVRAKHAKVGSQKV